MTMRNKEERDQVCVNCERRREINQISECWLTDRDFDSMSEII